MVSLLPLEEPDLINPEAVDALWKNPKSNPDMSLLLDINSQDRLSWLANAVKRWCPDALRSSSLHAALFTNNIVHAEREAARQNRPWLAALLASECPKELAKAQLANSDCDSISQLVLRLLAGQVDGIAEDHCQQNQWLLGYALRLFYTNSRPQETCKLSESFPNKATIPDMVSCLLVGVRPVFSPEALRFKILGVPDMLPPYLVSKALGHSDRSIKLLAAEQLIHNGLVSQACEVLLDEPKLLLDLFARFPNVSGDTKLKSIASAWSFHSRGDYEAEFDSWIAAERVEQAAAVFLSNLADHYVLSGEHSRLAARLSLLSHLRLEELIIYQLYLSVRSEHDSSASSELVRRMDSVSVHSLTKKVAYAEMAACACMNNMSNASLSRYLPPELILLHCHRILQH
jgi:hypothetical protein